MRRPGPAVAAMSSRILKPAGDRRGAISSKLSRRIMKKPDMGSDSGVPTSLCVSLVARREIVPRLSEKLAAEPPAT